MAKPLVTDELWEHIRPLLPPPKPRRFRYPGRKPIDDRKCLTGILFVLKTGINWEDLPCEMGCGSGMTCWRRLRDWNRAGVWRRLHEVLLAELQGADRIDWDRAVIDSSFARARGGGGRTGPSPVDRRKKGSKHTIITDGGGIPLVAISLQEMCTASQPMSWMAPMIGSTWDAKRSFPTRVREISSPNEEPRMTSGSSLPL